MRLFGFHLVRASDRPSQAKYGASGAQEIHCPECGAPEYFVVCEAKRAQIVAGEAVENAFGACVVCLVCDAPYVIAPHRAGGVMKRRRMIGGQMLPMPPPVPAASRKADANGQIDALAKDLGHARFLDEPD